MIIQKEKYIIMSKGHPLEFHESCGNMTYKFEEAGLYDEKIAKRITRYFR